MSERVFTVLSALKNVLARRRAHRDEQVLEARNDAIFAALPRAHIETTTLAPPFVPLERDSGGWDAAQAAIAALGIPADIPGGVNLGDRRAVYELIRQVAAKSALEVGTHVGASSHVMALAVLHNGGHRFDSVDIRDCNAPGAAWARVRPALPLPPRNAVQALGVSFARFFTRPSVEFLSSTADRYDFIFLDGGHQSSVVYQEVPLALRLLNPGGVILLHDVFPGLQPLWKDGRVDPGPWTAVQRFLAEGAPIKLLPLGKLRWPTKHDSNVTSLAVLTRDA
jgi:predicted O-methyltransferase YrrM